MAEKTYQCELCSHTPFKAPTALGRHKLSAHGIPGQSTAAIAYRKAKSKEKNGKPQSRTPHHLAHSPKSQHKETQAITRAKNQKGHIENDNRVPEGALAVAFGRFQELCRSFAYEYDLPPKLFTTRLTQLISASSVR